MAISIPVRSPHSKSTWGNDMRKVVEKDRPTDWTVSLEEFKQYKTGHDRLKDITSQVKSAIKRRGHEGIIMVVGPTRVGKTTLLRGVINSILLEKMSELEKDPGFLPAAWMEAYSYKRGYKWKDHWYGCLKALHEPLIEHKSAAYSIEPDRNARHAPSDYKYEQEDILRRSFENAARHRRTRVIGVDEAQSLVLGSPSNLHRSHVEVIKSVANTSQALHILCGNFDLLKLSNLSGQIGARSTRPIHFSRYHPKSKTDLESFAAVVLDLASKMPVPESPDFNKQEIFEYCLTMSLGLVGLLKVWFTDALGDVLENGRATVTLGDLEKQ
jgi:GTPase SAR1 family protein